MGYLKNTWVGYLQRTAQQVMDSVLIKLGTKVPEMTDISPNNPYIRNLNQFSGLTEQMNFYIDNAGRESHLDSARLYKSHIQHAYVNDYRVVGNSAESTNVFFSIDTPALVDIVIPAYVKLSANSIPFVTQEAATILAGQLTSNQVGVLQYTEFTSVNIGTATGDPNMQIEFNEKVLHDSIAVRVDTVSYFPQETLAFSSPTDFHFVQSVNENGNPIIYFGDGNPFGNVPDAGAALEADYKVTLGAAGFADVGDINSIDDTITVPPGITLSVTNPERTAGGGDVESTDSMKRRIPYANRTQLRAIARGDYQKIAELAEGVAKAGESFACGKRVTVYIVPDGGGIASSTLCNDTAIYMGDKIAATTNLDVQPAGELHIKITANITALSNYLNTVVQANAIAAVTGFINYINQTIRGTLVIGDVYQVIENAAGVLNSSITVFAAQPYARPISTLAPTLVWSRSLLSGSTTTTRWTIIFTSSTVFRVVKGSTLQGTYNVGDLVNFIEVSFTVSAGGYSAGNTYEFVTYPYNAGKLTLVEPSIPVSVSADLTFNVTGGL